MTLTASVKQYAIITANYWAFTLTDGALRMLVVLYFYQLGYAPLEIAYLFIFYELFGVVTNLIGGWLGARIGLNRTMNIGLGLQVLALAMLLVPTDLLTIVWVMAAQALSGIAKDLNKMSAKSAIKELVSDDQQGTLFKWVARLTGSKNALKGVGFFLGGALLQWLGFQGAVLSMACCLAVICIASVILLTEQLGKSKHKPKFSQLFSKSKAINALSAARLFLFGARDVWFVIALPVYFTAQLGWSHSAVGTFFALWIIGYGLIQSLSPNLLRNRQASAAIFWLVILLTVTLALSALQSSALAAPLIIIVGLFVFGAIFAINSALHSYLIVSMADADQVSVDVGFYYMANASGRLIGTLISGWVYQNHGLTTCLWVSFLFLFLALLCSAPLPRLSKS